MSITNNNQRIAKNTIFLYVRTIAVMFVSLYTSRLVLKILGESDLGIYNLVGGIVTLMTFLQAAQTKATSRFITYELGQNGEKEGLQRVFSLCMTIHIIIAIITLLLAETIGFFVINNLTDIPEYRMSSANIVYQISLITFIIHLVRCPYDSVIIAHEKMSVYAYMSVIEVVLQLLMVVCLLKYSGDCLVFYSVLICVVALVLFLCYFSFVKWKFSQYRFSWCWEKNKSFSILTFSGWTLLGSSSNTLSQQGVSLLMNNFVGLVANTALGFANQVNLAVGRFVASFTTAFNPQIIKYYSTGDIDSMHRLMNRASKFSFALCYMMVLPLVVNMEFILNLWLGKVPMYTTEFCQLLLICSLFDATTGVFNIAVTSTGKIRNYQIAISISFCLDFLCSFILLYWNIHPALVFGSRIITRGIINMMVGFYFSKSLIRFNLSNYLKEVVLPISLTLFVTMPSVFILSNCFDGWHKVFISISVSELLIFFCLLVIIMSKSERVRILSSIKNKIL